MSEAAEMDLSQLHAMEKVLDDVWEERMRQHERWGEQNHPHGTGRTGDERAASVARGIAEWGFLTGKGCWRDLLAEEVAEAFAETDPAKLRAELIQVAALACQWVEAIDRRQSKGEPRG